MTIEEMLEKKIDELAAKAASDAEKVFDNPQKFSIFTQIFQPRFEDVLGKMREILGNKEANEILKIYVKLNEDIDEFANRIFTN